MKLYHWLGKDAEAFEDAIAYRKAYYDERRGQTPFEADGFVTVYMDGNSLSSAISAYLPDQDVQVSKTKHGQSVAIGKGWSLFISAGAPVSPRQIAENWKHHARKDA